MKKFYFKIVSLVITFLMLIVVTGCNSSSNGSKAKEEVNNLKNKYADSYLQVLDKYDKDSENVDDWSPQLLEIGIKAKKELENVVNNIEAEKVSKQAEPYKNALKENTLVWLKLFTFATDELKAHIEKKPFDKKEASEFQKNFDRDCAQREYELENEYSKIINGKPATVMGVNGVNYLAYTASNVDMALISRKQTTDAVGKNPYFQKKPIGKFVIIKLFIKNNQKDAITVDSNSFKLFDKENREYSSSHEAMTALQIGNDSTKGFLTQLNPNMATDFTFVFDIPRDLKMNDLKIKAQGGFSGKAVLIPLTVVKITTVKQ